MSTLDFYKNIQSFENKEQILDPNNYHELPQDWAIVITDVVGSTNAIEKGLYKEVNIAGVTSIVSVKNILNDFDFPYVFGGDGATLLVPYSKINEVTKALSFCQDVIQQQFGLQLRAGIVLYKDLIAHQFKIEVAKLKLSEGNEIAMLQGNGILQAEKLIKNDSRYSIKKIEFKGSNDGLECRWNPIPSSQGYFLTLIVVSRSLDKRPLINIIEKIFTKTNQERFLTFEKLDKTWPPTYLKQEINLKYGSGIKSKCIYFLVLALTYVFSFIVGKAKKEDKSEVSRYMNQLVQNTDFMKVEESLKIVIDVSEKGAQDILLTLEEMYKSKLVFYGFHKSKEAMMTCFVRSLTKHIHFIDGGSGGYALAAKVLKNQIKLEETSS